VIDVAPKGRLLQKGDVAIGVQLARIGTDMFAERATTAVQHELTFDSTTGVLFRTKGTWIQDGNLTIISTDGIHYRWS
jgi:hypothetical protein